MTAWAYPDSFNTLTQVTNWLAAAGSLCCVFLLLSWALLPVDKTNRHYLSICLTAAVLVMNVSLCQLGNPAPTDLSRSASSFPW